MFVLGIDPGVTRCGYACVESTSRGPRALSLGVLRTDKNDELPQRLASLQSDLRELFVEFQPGALAIERVLFQVNVKTAMSVGQVSGLAMAEAAARGLSVAQYSPNEVKQAITGYGNADKQQMQKMVQTLLGLSAPPRPADAADAAGIALCHIAHHPLRAQVRKVTM